MLRDCQAPCDRYFDCKKESAEDQDYADRNFGDSDLSPAERIAAYRFSLGEPIKDDPMR